MKLYPATFHFSTYTLCAKTRKVALGWYNSTLNQVMVVADIKRCTYRFRGTDRFSEGLP